VRLLGIVAVLLLTGCGVVTPSTSSTPLASAHPASATIAPAATGTAYVMVTFYAGADNDPPGSSEIAHPNERHPAAGGTGTAADPITLASDPDELPLGTLVYYPPLRKYFVMEDECDSCIAEWRDDKRAHVDLWTSATTDPAVLDCEERLTPDDPVAVEVDPPPDRPVDPHPLFDTGRCWPDT